MTPNTFWLVTETRAQITWLENSWGKKAKKKINLVPERRKEYLV